MPSSISRGPITTTILTALLTAGFPVGDNAQPDDPFGWQGEPDETATFIPWMTLTPGAATPRPGTLADTGESWTLGYNVLYAGISRKQTEALADRMRNNLVNLARTSVSTDTGNWQIQQVRASALGSSNRVGSTYPDYFTQADSFELWITKG